MPASPLVSLVAVLIAMLIARCAARRELPAVRRALESRWAPLVAGMCTAAVTWLAWGTLRADGTLTPQSFFQLAVNEFQLGLEGACAHSDDAFVAIDHLPQSQMLFGCYILIDKFDARANNWSDCEFDRWPRRRRGAANCCAGCGTNYRSRAGSVHG